MKFNPLLFTVLSLAVVVILVVHSGNWSPDDKIDRVNRKLRNTAHLKIVRSNATLQKRSTIPLKKIEVYRILPRDSNLQKLSELVETLETKEGLLTDSPVPYIILTAGDINYVETVVNWIVHIQRLNITKYIVLCFDKELLEVVGSDHGILVTNSLNISAVPRKKLVKKTTTSSASTSSTSSTRYKRSSPIDRNNRQGTSLLSKISGWATKDKKNTKLNKGNRRLDSAASNDSKAKRIAEILKNASIKAALSKAGGTGKFTKIARRLPPGREFSIMSIAKYEFIRAVLEMGRTAVWSDADCVWLKPCIVHAFSQHSSPLHSTTATVSASIDADAVSSSTVAPQRSVDFLGQQGLTPVPVSNIIGACLCGGLFLVNPSNISKHIIVNVRNNLIQGTFFGRQFAERCDQTILNTLLLREGGFNSIFNGTREAFGFGANSSFDVQYSDDLGYNGLPMESWPLLANFHEVLTKTPANKVLNILITPHKIRYPLSVGVLPYHYYPRGHPIIPKAKARVRSTSRSSRKPLSDLLTPKKRTVLPTLTRTPSPDKRSLEDVEDNISLDTDAGEATEEGSAGGSDNTEEDTEEEESDAADEYLSAEGSNSNTSSTVDISTGEEMDRYAVEWRLYKEHACCWHMLTNAKSGPAKKSAMIRDGIYYNTSDKA